MGAHATHGTRGTLPYFSYCLGRHIVRPQVHPVGTCRRRNISARVDEKGGSQCLLLSSQLSIFANRFDSFAGQRFQFTTRQIFLTQLNVVHARAGALGNFFEQPKAAWGLISSKCAPIGDIAQNRQKRSRLWPGLGDLGHDFALLLRLSAKMVPGKAVAQKFEGVFGSIYDLEQAKVLLRNRARVHECLKVNNAVPVFTSINDDEYFLRQLVGLRESQDFEEFVHSAEAAGKDHQALGKIGKPKLTHKEIVKLKI